MNTNFLDGVIGVVEANSYESMCLWKEAQEHGFTWEEARMGEFVSVGSLEGRPVCMTLNVHTIKGQRILFIDPTSQVVDHAMIEHWLMQKLPESAFDQHKDGKYLNKVNAMNFHNVFPR